MEPNNHILIIIISLSLSSFSAIAICVPRNSTHINPSQPPSLAPPPVETVEFILPTLSPPPASALLPTLSPPTTQPSESKTAKFGLPTFSPPPASSFSPADPAIKKVCESTDNPLLCLSSIVPYLRGGNTLGPLSILEMAIKACANRTSLALSEAKRIATDPSTSSVTSSYLETCQENYSDAIDNLQNAADAMANRDVGTMNSMLSAALTDFSTCEDGFLEVPGVDSPMAEIDDTLSKMASNCLAIVSLIH